MVCRGTIWYGIWYGMYDKCRGLLWGSEVVEAAAPGVAGLADSAAAGVAGKLGDAGTRVGAPAGERTKKLPSSPCLDFLPRTNSRCRRESPFWPRTERSRCALESPCLFCGANSQSGSSLVVRPTTPSTDEARRRKCTRISCMRTTGAAHMIVRRLDVCSQATALTLSRFSPTRSMVHVNGWPGDTLDQ